MIQARALETRARILTAALDLLAERGFHGTSVPDIARRARVGAGTIYRHFTDKQGLVNAVFREAKARLARHIGGSLADLADPRAAFGALWRGLWAFAQAEPAAFQFLELHDHQPYLDRESRDVEAAILVPLFMACAQLQRAAVFRAAPDAATLMALIWGAFVGVAKAERQGYLVCDETTPAHTAAAVWALLCVDPEEA